MIRGFRSLEMHAVPPSEGERDSSDLRFDVTSLLAEREYTLFSSTF
jgi:hypothetical protein